MTISAISGVFQVLKLKRKWLNEDRVKTRFINELSFDAWVGGDVETTR